METREYWVYLHINGNPVVRAFVDMDQEKDFEDNPFVVTYKLIASENREKAIEEFLKDEKVSDYIEQKRQEKGE